MRRWIVLFCFVVVPAILFFGFSLKKQAKNETDLQYYAGLIRLCADTQDEWQPVITAWKTDTDPFYYLFLPSYLKGQSSCRLSDDTDGISISLNGTILAGELDLLQFQENVAYPLLFQDASGVALEEGSLKILYSSSLPTLYLTTRSGNMRYLDNGKEGKEEGSVLLVSESGETAYAGEMTSLKGRGNATWEYPKKPYAMKLKEEAGLLGMNPGKDWALLANWADKSFLRNKIAYDLAEGAGLQGTSQAEFVDLYLNGEYTGTYQLTSKVKAPASYFMEMEIKERFLSEPQGFLTEAGQAVTLKDPMHATKEELKELEIKIQQLENAILAEDGSDPKSGKHYTQLLDMDSWVKVYLVQEIMQNYDAYVSSLFFSVENIGEDKVFCGPVWDFDWSLVQRDGTGYKVLTASQSRHPYRNYWMPELTKKAEFQQEAAEQYQSLFLPVIQKITDEMIPLYQDMLLTSLRLDAVRWNRGGVEEWQDNTENMKQYLLKRSNWLKEYWQNKEDYITVVMELNSDGFYTLEYYLLPGESCVEYFPEGIRKQGYEFGGFLTADTSQPFDPAEPVWEDTHIKAVWITGENIQPQSWLDKIRNSQWFTLPYLISGVFVLFLAGLLIAEVWMHGSRKRR